MLQMPRYLANFSSSRDTIDLLPAALFSHAKKMGSGEPILWQLGSSLAGFEHVLNKRADIVIITVKA